MPAYLAVDLGAESGRVLRGEFDGARLVVEEVHRFPNDPVRRPGELCWDIEGLYREVLGRPDLDRAVALSLGQRAFQFHEEWFGEDPAPLLEVLSRMFDVDPSPGGWAFQHLTMVYTNRERWDDLLSLYDRVIESAPDPVPLLEEAAGLAKDVAGKPDRERD